MMMAGPGFLGGMLLGLILADLLLLGFAYIIWILSSKESGGIKLTGQVLSAAIAVIVIILFLYSAIYGGLMGKGKYGKGCGMMGAEKGKMMQKMMKAPEMKKMMKEMGKIKK